MVQLLVNLTDINMLPSILRKFKDVRICKGVSSEKLNTFKEIAQIETNEQMWHHQNCTVISLNYERCRACKKLSKASYMQVWRKKKV